MSTLKTAALPQEYSDHIALLRETEPDLASELAGFTGIAHVLNWLAVRQPGPLTIDLVAMDEFEYDWLVRLEPDGRWLMFGVT